MPRKNASMWNTLPIDMSSVSVRETVGGRPRCSTMNQTSSALLPCDEGHRLRLDPVITAPVFTTGPAH